MTVFFTVIFAAAAAACAVTAAHSWRSRESNGAARALTITLGGCASWSLADMVTTVGPSADVQIWAVKLSYAAIYATVLGLSLLCRMLVDPRYRPRRAVVALLVGPSLAMLAYIFVEPVPGSFFRSITAVGSPGYARVEFGPIFYVHTAFCYTLLGSAFLYVLVERRRAAPVFRKQLNSFVLGAFIPVAGNVISVTAPALFEQRDLTPVFFTMTALLGARSLSQGLLRIIPVARARVVESISDGVLVIDVRGRIVDVNPPARALIHELRPGYVGEFIGASTNGLIDVLFDGWDDGGVDARTVEVLPGRFFDLRTTVISDIRGRIVGRVLMCHDITELVRARNDLEKQLQLVDRLRGELVEQTLRDPLTGAYNRRYLNEALRNALAEADRSGRSVAVLVVDIDHFKSVNDLYGHQTGDIALVAIVRALAGQVRGHDAIARYGGEEFVVVLPGASRTEALRRAEQIRTTCNATAIAVPASVTASVPVEVAPASVGADQPAQLEPAPVGSSPLHVTVSIGCALYPEDGDSAEAVVAAADTALYLAKSGGRNRVVDATTVTLSCSTP